MYCVVIVNILNVCSENIVSGKFHNNTVIQLSFPTLMRLIRGFVGNGQLMLTCLFRDPSYIKEGLAR